MKNKIILNLNNNGRKLTSKEVVNSLQGNDGVIAGTELYSEEILSQLFNYNGYCNIYYAFLLDQDSQKHDLIIKRPALTTWNTMNKKNDLDGTSKTQVWESLTTDYELMESNLRNDYVKTKKRVSTYDVEAKTYSKIYETTLKPSKLTKKDTNLTTLSKLQAQVKDKQKQPKTGTRKIRGTY